jgi:hypothetical protein
MISVIPFELDDAMKMPKLMSVFSKEGDVRERLQKYAQDENCIVLSLTDSVHGVLGVVGGHFIWDTSMHVFAAFSEEFARQPVSMLKGVLKAIEFTAREFGILRFQMDVRASQRQASRFAESLGFVKECDMRNYGPGGETYSLYARYM